MGFILGNDAELSLDNPGPPCVTQHPQIHMLTTHPLPVFSVPEDKKFFCRSDLFLSTTSFIKIMKTCANIQESLVKMHIYVYRERNLTPELAIMHTSKPV